MILFWQIMCASLGSVLLGSAWYHPRVFGTDWMRLGHITPEKAERAAVRSAVHFALAVALHALVAGMLAYLARMLDLAGLFGAAWLALVAWIAFVIPVLASSVLWEQREATFYLINVTYWLVALAFMATIVVP